MALHDYAEARTVECDLEDLSDGDRDTANHSSSTSEPPCSAPVHDDLLVKPSSHHRRNVHVSFLDSNFTNAWSAESITSRWKNGTEMVLTSPA